METMFSNLLSWLISGVLLPLTAILRLVGMLLPPCSSMGVVTLTTETLNGMAQAVRFLWPFIQYVPWVGLWNLVSAVLLYGFFRWLWGFIPHLMSLGPKFLVIIIVIYVMSGVFDFFTSSAWRDSSVFTDAFGQAPEATYSGGGFGGGGGGSW